MISRPIAATYLVHKPKLKYAALSLLSYLRCWSHGIIKYYKLSKIHRKHGHNSQNYLCTMQGFLSKSPSLDEQFPRIFLLHLNRHTTQTLEKIYYLWEGMNTFFISYIQRPCSLVLSWTNKFNDLLQQRGIWNRKLEWTFDNRPKFLHYFGLNLQIPNSNRNSSKISRHKNYSKYFTHKTKSNTII